MLVGWTRAELLEKVDSEARSLPRIDDTQAFLTYLAAGTCPSRAEEIA